MVFAVPLCRSASLSRRKRPGRTGALLLRAAAQQTRRWQVRSPAAPPRESAPPGRLRGACVKRTAEHADLSGGGR
eukprot:gene7342-4973_t